MYGQIHLVFKEMVEAQFGELTWKKIVGQSGMDEDKDFLVFCVYDDILTSRLLETVCRVLDISKDRMLKDFGTYFLTYCTKHGYDKMLQTMGQDLFTFVQNLDSLYSMLSLSYKGIVSPSFRCQEHNDGSMTLDYFSWREGFYPFVQGIVEAVGRDLYNELVKVRMISSDQMEVEGGRIQYHASMRIEKVLSTEEQDTNEQTAREERRQQRRMSINIKNFVEGDREERQHQRRMSINIKNFVEGGQRSLMTVADMGFAFPYHVLMDSELKILQCGNNIHRLLSSPIDSQTRFCDIATLVQPIIQTNAKQFIRFINSVFIIRVGSGNEHQQPLTLKGQMMWLPNSCRILFMGSPRMRSLNDVKDQKVFLSDFMIYDSMRQLLLLNQQRMTEIEAAIELDETTTALKNTSNALAQEKQKTDELLLEMMPRKVARQLTEYGYVNAEKHDGATVLFSSTLTFADIVWTCSADEVVDMLNDMYFRFDAHTDVHKVYKVETIGDAYMAVTGVPEAQVDHAERMADFAMDMIVEASYVRSPATGLPLQIQVGFHSGTVVAGVIGKKKPRYDIYGDTVNTASRMCGNSVPGRIHVTNVTFQKLIKRGYVFKNRGEIQVKGKGKMTTYFLVGTLERDLEQPDDKFSFLPDILDADAEINPTIKKLVKKQINMGQVGKLMTVQQSRKSMAWTRPMLDVQTSSQMPSSSLAPIFPADRMSETLLQGTSSAAKVPSHHKQTWNLSPPPPSAAVGHPVPAPVSKPRTPHGRAAVPSPPFGARLQRKISAVPEHHRQTWNLSPPPAAATDFLSQPDPVHGAPTANKSNSSCNVSDFKSPQRSVKRSNSCHMSTFRSSNPAVSPNKSNSSCNQSSVEAGPRSSDTSSSTSEQGHAISCSSIKSSGQQGDLMLTLANPKRSDLSTDKQDFPEDPDSPTRTDSLSQQCRDFPMYSPLPPALSPRAAHEGLYVWKDVRQATSLGTRARDVSIKHRRPAALLRARRGTSTSHETTSLQEATSQPLSASSRSKGLLSLKRHSIPAFRIAKDEDTDPSDGDRQADKKSCMIS